jgi:outer membrane protein insertion porin family
MSLAAAPLCGQTPPAAGSTQPKERAESPADQHTSTEDQRVVSIRIVSESGEVLMENPAELPLQAGQPLGSEAVRESLRQLYRTGRYADLRAETRPVDGGLRLDFVVRQNFYINLVHVTGLREPPGEPVALASLRLGLGETFRKSAVNEALERLRQTLQDEGFYQAQVAYEISPQLQTHQMDLTVRVTPGPRARLGAITLRNHTEFPDNELLSRTKLRRGRELTSARLARAGERLRKFLVQKDHLSARVALHRGEYDPKGNALPLEIELTTGPRVRVEVTGAKIPARELRKMVPIYQEGAVDEDLLQEGRRAIRDYQEREGYSDVQVRYSILPASAQPAGRKSTRGAPPDEQVITYTVERGGRHRLVGVAFVGNKYFSDDLLRSRLRLVTAALASRGRFSRRLMEDDATSIREIYVANGYREAQVRSELLDNYRGKGGDLFVRYHIEEGLQTRVAELKLEGNQAIRSDDLLAVVGSSQGEPYSEFNVSGDRDNILALYYNEGFPEARFSVTVEEAPPAPEPSDAASLRRPGGSPQAEALAVRRVRLTYRIVEGRQLKVAGVLVGGYEHTRPEMVERAVLVKSGQPLREGEVVETQRRLYNLGIFSRVSIAPQNPGGTDPAKTMTVLVEEAKRYTLGYGFGVEVQRLGGAGDPVNGVLRASPRGLFEIGKANLTGRADTLSFKIRASTFQGRALLSYAAPETFGRPALSLQVTGFADKTRDILTFTSTRYEGTAQLAQRVSIVTSVLYRYSFRKVLVDASSLRISPDQIPLFSQPTRVSLFGATWFRERRNNPADATHGDFNSVDVSLAGKPIGSSASFLRVVVQNSTYHPFGRRFVFARSARFGMQTPVGGTLPREIPLPERFFAGGGNSLRGFGLNQAGPRDATTGFPVGGQASLIFNQELRFPMHLPFVGSRLGGTLFYDAGNVFSRLGRITLRASPSSPADLNYFSHTIGFGIRYATPIGPVRIDMGYQLHAASFCATGPMLPPGVPPPPGPAGCAAGQTLARLPRFQFFFNLGSTF